MEKRSANPLDQGAGEARSQKETRMTNKTEIAVYKNVHYQTKKLLKSIAAGLEKHTAVSIEEGINWTSVEDLQRYRRDLQLISDALNLESEYAKE